MQIFLDVLAHLLVGAMWFVVGMMAVIAGGA